MTPLPEAFIKEFGLFVVNRPGESAFVIGCNTRIAWVSVEPVEYIEAETAYAVALRASSRIVWVAREQHGAVFQSDVPSMATPVTFRTPEPQYADVAGALYSFLALTDTWPEVTVAINQTRREMGLQPIEGAHP